MAKSANQKIKILYLLKILNERTDDEHGITTDELITALSDYGVTAERKTLYDDIETLRLFGVDIEKRKSKTVTYHVVSRNFELPELKLLVDAIQASKFITHKKSAELINKIEGLASRYQAQLLQRQVFVANRIKNMNESIYYSVDYIHEAISNNVKITFQYFEWNQKKQKQLRHGGKIYSVSPFALTWDDENYYMIAFDSEENKIKHYRVDKMLNIELTSSKRDGADHFKNFDTALYSKKTFGMYGSSEETVTLRCSNRLASVMLDRFGHDISLRAVNENQFEFTVRVYASPHFLTWLMNFAGEVKIISPKKVIADYIALAKKALCDYEV